MGRPEDCSASIESTNTARDLLLNNLRVNSDYVNQPPSSNNSKDGNGPASVKVSPFDDAEALRQYFVDKIGSGLAYF